MILSFVIWIVLFFGAFMLVFPAFLAFKKKHDQRWAILVLNVLAVLTMFMWYGVTLLVWGAAMVWACTNQNKGVTNGAVNR